MAVIALESWLWNHGFGVMALDRRGFLGLRVRAGAGNSSTAESPLRGVTGKAQRLLNCIQSLPETSFLAVLPEFYAGAKSPVEAWINHMILRNFMVNPRGAGKPL
jgi:hypothetical protein